MIERYSRPEMANIWSEENKYRAWLEVEILADEAWAELGEIPKEDVALIREKADFDIDRILEIEQETRHDVVAFTRAVSETLGEERKWVHYGLTSTDVVDTAYGYLTSRPTTSSVVTLKTSPTSSLTKRKNTSSHHDGSYPRGAR